MEAIITIIGKIPGKSRPLFEDWQMSFPPGITPEGRRLTLRNLITSFVTEEVNAFRERQEQRRTVRALTEADISTGLMRGKVDMGRREAAAEAYSEAVIRMALQAFEDRLYYVFIDDTQTTVLD